LQAGGCFCAAPAGDGLASERGSSVVHFDLSAGRERRIEGVARKVLALALFPDGRTLAVAEPSGTIQVRDLPTGRLLRHVRVDLPGPIPGPKAGLVFSPDGAFVTTGGSWDGTLPLWDTRTGREVRRLRLSAGLIHSVTFSPDGSRLAAAARDETIRVVRTATGQLRHTVGPHGDAGVTALAFSPDGRALVTGAADGTIRYRPLPGEER
jgi:WD40 repeat protein